MPPPRHWGSIGCRSRVGPGTSPARALEERSGLAGRDRLDHQRGLPRLLRYPAPPYEPTGAMGPRELGDRLGIRLHRRAHRPPAVWLRRYRRSHPSRRGEESGVEQPARRHFGHRRADRHSRRIRGLGRPVDSVAGISDRSGPDGSGVRRIDGLRGLRRRPLAHRPRSGALAEAGATHGGILSQFAPRLGTRDPEEGLAIVCQRAPRTPEQSPFS